MARAGHLAGLKKRSVSLTGHATSLALEPEFWAVIDAAAVAEGLSLAGLIGRIDDERGERPLASACRVFALSQSQKGVASGLPSPLAGEGVSEADG
jgi:predicted DNA-binding ribbon-helix-helix protein